MEARGAWSGPKREHLAWEWGGLARNLARGAPEGLCRREDASAFCSLHRIKRDLTFLCLPVSPNLFMLLTDRQTDRPEWVGWQCSEQAQLAGALS